MDDFENIYVIFSMNSDFVEKNIKYTLKYLTYNIFLLYILNWSNIWLKCFTYNPYTFHAYPTWKQFLFLICFWI